MYRPLPDCLTIKDSKIQGLGLFATMMIKAKTNLGLTHIYNESHEDNYIRTPLGGFFNHNHADPNCRILKDDCYLFLVAIKDIQPGEELTAKYTLYNPELVV
jgi:SET domain-containing protein